MLLTVLLNYVRLKRGTVLMIVIHAARMYTVLCTRVGMLSVEYVVGSSILRPNAIKCLRGP
jgi:hypothetical protein